MFRRAGDEWRLLYHFTGAARLATILADRSIDGRPLPGSATPFVWLTDAPDPVLYGITYAPHDDAQQWAARITVSVAGAQRWENWAPKHVSRRDRRRIERAGGGAHTRWWIVAADIPDDQWIDIEPLTGEPDPGTGTEPGGPEP